MDEHWMYDFNFNVSWMDHPQFKGMHSIFYGIRYDYGDFCESLVGDFESGRWITARIWFDVCTMANAMNSPSWLREPNEGGLFSRELGKKPMCLEIDFRRHGYEGFVIKDSKYEVLYRRICDMPGVPWYGAAFHFIEIFFKSFLFARSCVIQKDILDRDEHITCLQWGLDRVLEHPCWLGIPSIYLRDGNREDLKRHRAGDWPDFRRMFAKTLEEWNATGNAWPLGDPDASMANKRMELLRIHEGMRTTKKAKRGMLL